jgi:hypothetical protein
MFEQCHGKKRHFVAVTSKTVTKAKVLTQEMNFIKFGTACHFPTTWPIFWTPLPTIHKSP